MIVVIVSSSDLLLMKFTSGIHDKAFATVAEYVKVSMVNYTGILVTGAGLMVTGTGLLV